MSTDRLSALTTVKAKNFMLQEAKTPEAKLLNLAIKEFGEDAKFILEQMHLQEKAELKVPGLAALPWLFTAKSFEQCTAEPVARFKAELMADRYFTDLTAGAGVDAYFVLPQAERLQLVEADAEHAALIRHNFAGKAAVQLHEGLAEEVLPQLLSGGTVYLDPDRRSGGQRVFDFSASSPDVTKLLPALFEKFEQVWIKASPMNDITACELQLGKPTAVYAICWQDELKELLFHYQPGFAGITRYEAVLLGKNGLVADRFSSMALANTPEIANAVPGMYLLEPHAGLTKLRLDKAHAAQAGLKAFNPQAAYYMLPYWLSGYPGRQFLIKEVLPYKPKVLQSYLQGQGIKRVHMAKRDFFLEVAAIRKVLKMPDGDDARLFFTKDANGIGICVVCDFQRF
ncbi:MAG: class I SAM-dependent methyltransferase [Sphingobacteriaceae bacterium]|nr:class I SAM-dependent methyltransferase [Sphingobacteriaceae bacterium]